MKVLNVGGGSYRILPKKFDGWQHVILDIDPNAGPDIVGDCRKMKELSAAEYDAVYSSHTIEHLFKHEVRGVLEGFRHVLKDSGFIEVIVPNIVHTIKEMFLRNHDIMDVWYRTGEGIPIRFHDVLYGWGHAIESGNEYYAHKCGFTPQSLSDDLFAAGFPVVELAVGENISAIARKVPECQ